MSREKTLKKVFDKITYDENPSGKIDNDTVLEITQDEISLMPEAIKHFTGKDIFFLPLGYGRKPGEYVVKIVLK